MRQLIHRLDEIYCGNVGYEFQHIYEQEAKDWLRKQVETKNNLAATS